MLSGSLLHVNWNISLSLYFLTSFLKRESNTLMNSFYWHLKFEITLFLVWYGKYANLAWYHSFQSSSVNDIWEITFKRFPIISERNQFSMSRRHNVINPTSEWRNNQDIISLFMDKLTISLLVNQCLYHNSL